MRFAETPDTVLGPEGIRIRVGTAIFDGPDEIYRYRLTRTWNPQAPALHFCMLNPSKATETILDPTVARCLERAKRAGYGRLIVTNLFAYRATDPDELDDVPDPVGPLNDGYINGAAREAAATIAAWGVDGRERARAVLRLLEIAGVGVQCLGTTRAGDPRHPLYVAYAKQAEPYSSRA